MKTNLTSNLLPAIYADMLIDSLENPEDAENCAGMLVNAAKQGDLDKLVSFEALLILGSPRAFDLDIDPNRVAKKQLLSQVWNPWGVELRRDPRFKEWAEKLGYVDFWRKYGWPDRCRSTAPDDFECI